MEKSHSLRKNWNIQKSHKNVSPVYSTLKLKNCLIKYSVHTISNFFNSHFHMHAQKWYSVYVFTKCSYIVTISISLYFDILILIAASYFII